MVSERCPTGDRAVSKSVVLSMGPASTQGPKHPRELRFPSGEGELTSIPRPASPAVVTASASGGKVLSQHNGDALGHQHEPLEEVGPPESSCPAPQQGDLSSFAD